MNVDNSAVSKSATLLLIDDEPRIRTFIRISLQAEGFDYFEAANGHTGIQLAEQLQPDLVILDLGLPDMDGLDVLQSIRRQSAVPVLVLTARDDEDYKVLMFEQGANDYLTKPFGIRELTARIRVLLRDLQHLQTDTHEVYHFGRLTIDQSAHRVQLGGTSIGLSRNEYKLLWLLASNYQKLVPQATLIQHIWGAHHHDDVHYLRVLISQLRRKLNDSASEPGFIETQPGVGYRFLLSPEPKT